MVAAARKTTDTEGTSALVRHPDVDLFDYVNRGCAALYRLLTLVDGGQRYISSSTITTVAGTEAYNLPSDFMTMFSLGGEIDGVQRWFSSYEMNERPALIDTSVGWLGEPFMYRLRTSTISLLPIPQDVYSLTLWYSPAPSTLTTGQTFDTIARLDDYIIWWAAKEVCKKDRNWELHDRLTADITKLEGQIDALSRLRDQNGGARIIDISSRDRYGRVYRGGLR